MKLYWGSGSGPCMKVLMVLAEKKKLETCEKWNEPIEFSKKEHKSEEVLKINPRGQVPAFVDGDIVVNESTAICMYLDEKYPESGPVLIPKDRTLRYQVLQRMSEENNINQKVLGSVAYYKARTAVDKRKDLTEEIAAAHEELLRWDGYVAGRDYLVGNQFTMADVFLYTDLATLDRQALNMANLYPNLAKYFDGIKTRESAAAARPPHWDDTSTLGPQTMADFEPVVSK